MKLRKFRTEWLARGSAQLRNSVMVKFLHAGPWFNDWAPRSRKREVSRRFAPWNWTSFINCLDIVHLQASREGWRALCTSSARLRGRKMFLFIVSEVSAQPRRSDENSELCAFARARARERETQQRIRSIKSIRGSRRVKVIARGRPGGSKYHATPLP